MARIALYNLSHEKDGITGLKRALQYKTVGELLRQEFGVDTTTLDGFLKASFKQYDLQGNN